MSLEFFVFNKNTRIPQNIQTYFIYRWSIVNHNLYILLYLRIIYFFILEKILVTIKMEEKKTTKNKKDERKK